MDIDGKKRGIERLKKFVEFCKKYPRIKKAVAIHGLYTASGKYIEECVLLAEKMGVNLFHIHFCEYDGEVGMIKAKHKVRHPSEVLMKYFDGLKHNLILAHCVKLDEVDFLNLKKLGAAVSHNPVSNLKLGCGIANITKMKKKGITVGIGTDGQGSCGPLSVLENAKFASLLQKGIQEDPTILTGYEALKLATLDGAKALRLEKTKGSISIGKDADVVL
jgi:5-methylthioadenosine/S-adenosylhomocysteine deaminase